MSSRRLFHLLTVLAALASLSACSGGDGGGGPHGGGADATAPDATASLVSGTYDDVQTVTLSASDAGDPAPVIRYSLDGSDPTATGQVYAGPITIDRDSTLKFVATDASANTCAVETRTYVIGLGGGSVEGTTASTSADFDEIAARLNAILALGYNTTTPDNVMKQLSGVDPAKRAEDLFIVDTREPADFDKGHIPGAINVPLQSLAQRLVDGTSGIPADKEVVVASYWGNDGNMASFLINVSRITDPVAQKAALDAKTTPPFPKSTALFQGMTSWSFKRDLVPAGTRFDDALAGSVIVDKATEKSANAAVAPATPVFPLLGAFTSSTDTVIKKTLQRAKKYLNSVPTQFDLEVYPSALAANLQDGNPGNDPVIVSVRGADDANRGRIPGAVGISPYTTVAQAAKYSALDPSKKIVVYCYTGHTGALATIALGILGYDVKNVLYGMNGWTQDTAVTGSSLVNFDATRAWDFPLHNWGSGLDTVAAYTPPAGCRGCHTSLTAIWLDRAKAPPAAAVAAPSSGEG